MQNNFLPSLFFVLIIVLVLLSVVAVCYLYITAKNRERLALIERGMNPNLARSDFWLQIGIIAGGIAGGLMLGDIIPHSTYGPLFGVVLAGAGLVIYNYVRKTKMWKEGSKF